MGSSLQKIKEDPYKNKLKYPIVGIGIRIFNKENKVLMGKRKKDGLWGYPGGRQEKFETWKECGRREVLEETGLDIPID